tara:strand:- start:650 stop:862 length:213 start_codon:yes stop_codon:yes gene_type:complete
MYMNLSDFDDPILDERNGKKPVYVDSFLVSEFIKFCRTQKKDPRCVAEYLLKLGIHTASEDDVCIDIKNL